MKAELHRQRSENCIVDERRSQIGQHAGTVLILVFEQESSDHVIEHGIAEKFETLKRVTNRVGWDRSNGEGDPLDSNP